MYSVISFLLVFQKALLRTGDNNLLPEGPPTICNLNSENDYCLKAGRWLRVSRTIHFDILRFGVTSMFHWSRICFTVRVFLF